MDAQIKNQDIKPQPENGVSYFVSQSHGSQEGQSYQDPREAAKAFHEIPANDRPSVIRIKHGEEIAPGGSGQVIASTTGKAEAGQKMEYSKYTASQDKMFDDAYKELAAPKKDIDALLAEQETKIAAIHGQPKNPATEEGREAARAAEMGIKQSGLSDAEAARLIKEQEAKIAAAETVNTIAQTPGQNQVESDEIFTARQSEIKPVVPPEVESQYLRVGDKYFHSKNTDMVAFEDKGNKLETKSNSENIAESMVRIAEARGWDEIKVSGSETFKKEVWLEAAARGMHVKGYTPTEQDKAALAKRTNELDSNKIEKENKPFRAREKDAEAANPNKAKAAAFANEAPEAAAKKYPELAGAAAFVAATDKQAEAHGYNPAERAVIAAKVRQNVINSIERGHTPEVKIKEEVEIQQAPKEDKEYTR